MIKKKKKKTRTFLLKEGNFVFLLFCELYPSVNRFFPPEKKTTFQYTPETK